MPSLVDARTKLNAELSSKLTAAFASPAPAPVILVRAPGGTGKTHMLAQLLREKRVVWFGERTAMLGQLSAFLTTRLPSVQPLPAYGTGDIEKRPSKKDDGMCLQFDKLVLPLRGRGLGRFEAMLACRSCPDRDACAYRRWRPSKPWLFVPHVRLGLGEPMTDIFHDRDVVVIDESPLATALASVTLDANEIHEVCDALAATPKNANALGDHTIAQLHEVFTVIRGLLDHPPAGRKRVELRRLLEDLAFVTTTPKNNVALANIPVSPALAELDATVAAIEMAFGTNVPSPSLAPLRIKLDSVMFALQRVGLRSDLADRVMRLFEALAADTGPRPACVVVLPEPNRHRGAVVGGRLVRPPIPGNVPVVVLDATAESLPYRVLFPGREIVAIDVAADLQARVLQITSNRYPAATLREPRSFDRLMRAVDRFKQQNPTKKVAIVLKQELRHRHEKRISRAGIKPSDIFHFWALRGVNELRDYDALFVFGAPEVDPFEVEGMCRALLSAVPIAQDETPFNYLPIEPPNDWATVTTSLRGSTVSLPDRGFDRAGPDAVFWALHQAEYIQTILRLRPYDPANKGKCVFFLSNVVLPFQTELVDEKELTDGGPPGLLRLIRAADSLRASMSFGLGKISQRELARQAGVTEARVSQIVRDARTRNIWPKLLEELRQLTRNPRL